MSLYEFVMKSLQGANMYRDVERTRESIALLEPLRQAWHQAAAEVASTTPAYSGFGQALA
jgi:flagellar protein FliS